MASGFELDPHSERGFACPKNKFGITDYADLQRFEGPLVAKRGGELEDRGITGKFDVPHLQAIHRYLFQDVFPWAGEIRVVNIYKGSHGFGPAQFLRGAISDVLERLKDDRFLRGLDPAGFSARAGYFLGEINAVHPFREGNGRTQREFIRQLAESAGHPLMWAGFSQQAMTDASIASHVRGDFTGLSAIVHTALLSTRRSAGQIL